MKQGAAQVTSETVFGYVTQFGLYMIVLKLLHAIYLIFFPAIPEFIAYSVSELSNKTLIFNFIQFTVVDLIKKFKIILDIFQGLSTVFLS